MSLSLNYTQLVANLQSWVEDQSPDFTSNIDTIIGMGELKVLRDLNLTIFDVESSVTIANGNNLLTKPTGLLEGLSLRYVNGSGQLTYLQPRSKDWINDYGGSGDPLYFCEQSATQWKVAPTPNAGRTATALVSKRPAQISSGTPTTWLSTNVADLFFYGCLVCSEEYLKSDDRIPVWKTKYDELLVTAKLELKHMIRADYPIQ